MSAAPPPARRGTCPCIACRAAEFVGQQRRGGAS